MVRTGCIHTHSLIYPSTLLFRYLRYISDMVGDKAYKPHSNSVTIKAIHMTSVPLFNAIK